MVSRSDLEAATQPRFNGMTRVAAVSFVVATLVAGCIPKRSCEFTRTCPPDGLDAATEATSPEPSPEGSGLPKGDANALPIDAAAPTQAGMDSGIAPVPIIACARSTDCTPELPFCEDAAKVCTGCRSDRDCKNADAPWCLQYSGAPQNNHCVACLTSQDCDEGVCHDHACVACNTDTDEGCGGKTPLCASIGGTPTCVACEVDLDCEGTPDTPTCSDNLCKACSAENPSHCPAQKPVCIEEATKARCVGCTDSAQCQSREEGGGAVCIEEQCTACVLGTSEGCPAIKPFCAAAVPEPDNAGVSYLTPTQSQTPTASQYLQYEHVCIECPNDNACGGSLPSCFNGQCVQCTEDAHCKEASASVCDTSTHTCVGCQAIGDCTHLTATPACDVSAGRCVECTREEQGACDRRPLGFEYVCVTIADHADYQTCSTLERENSGQCTECVSDLQCLPGLECVPETFGVPSGDGGNALPTGKSYCLKLEAELGLCGNNRPFVGAFEATSEGGVPGRYCRPGYTTCEGYLAWKTGPDTIPNGQPGAGDATCLTNDSCGLPDVDDGFCVSVSQNANLCTYECGSELDCKSGATCNFTNPPQGVLAGNGVCDFGL